MQVSFTLTLQEFRTYQMYHRWGTPGRIISRMLVHLFYVVAALYLGGGHMLATVGIFLGFEVLLFLTLRFTTGRAFRQNPLVHDEQIISISPEILSMNSSKGKSELKWEAISRVITRGRLILLYMGQRQAVVVPTRAFESPGKEREFVALVAQYCKSI